MKTFLCLSLFSLLIIQMLDSSAALQFFLEARGKKCFYEDLPLGSNARMTFIVAQGEGEMPVSLRVGDMAGKIIYQKDSIDHNIFSFDTPTIMPGVKERGNWALRDDENDEDDEGYYRMMPGGAGDNRVRYSLCFTHSRPRHLPGLRRHATLKRKILFRIDTGTDSRTMEDYDKLAKETHLSSTEDLFRAVEERVSDVVRLIDEMRERELRMEHLNVKTTNTVTMYCTLSCLCIALGAVYASHATFIQFSKKRVA